MAAGDTTQKFGTHAHLTITLASLASSASAGRQSAALDIAGLGANALDILFQVKVTLGAGTIANDKCVYVYAAPSEDGDKVPDPATTSGDAACNTSNNMVLAAVLDTPTQSVSYISKVFSLASLCGGVLPRKVVLVIRNYSGIALSATEGDHEVTYTPVFANTAAS